jgi:hypothetical protein
MNISLSHSVVANNTTGSGMRSDLLGNLTADFSLIGDATGGNIVDNGGNLIGTGGAPIDPLLGPLADNGGPTLTHALLAGSPAIDMGDPGFDSDDPDGDPMTDDALPYDQRGAIYARVYGGRIDMGALEVQPQHADFDEDGDVDGLDFLAWQIGFGTTAPNAVKADGDADNDTDVDAADLAAWENAYGAGGGAPLVAALTHSSPSTGSGQAEGRESAVLSAQLVDLAMIADESNGDFGMGIAEWVDEELSPQVTRARGVTELDAAPRSVVPDFGDIAVSRRGENDADAGVAELDAALVETAL